MALKSLSTSPATHPQGQTQHWDYDITIVGGNLVGSTLACALKNSGLKIAIIETQPLAVAASKRQAYAISLLSGRIFHGIGVWRQILPQITPFQKIRLSDADYPNTVEFYPTDLGTDALGYVGEHRVLLTALQEFLADCPRVHWFCPAEVVQVDYQSDYVTLEIKAAADTTDTHAMGQADAASAIQPQTLRTRLVIAADGARSPLRTAAGIETKGWKYWQSCISTTFKTEKSHENIAYERFWPSGPMGVLPLSGNRCQVVWTAPHAEAKALKELDETEFVKLLEYRTRGTLGKLELDAERFVFPVQLMQSDDYARHRLALIGDAAHCCHPVGGQGLNMGIRDVAALAEVLKAAVQKGEDIGDLQVLKRYEQWRQKENLAILGFTDFLDRAFSNNWLPMVGMRRLGLWVLRKVPLVKILALRLMTGLMGRSPELANLSQ